MANVAYLVNLTDVTPRRATVTSVLPAGSAAQAMNFAVVSDPDLVPVVGERVWIANSTAFSRGERTITGRGPARVAQTLYTVRILAEEHTHYEVSAESPPAALVAAKRRAIDDMFDDHGGTYSVIAGRADNGGLGFSAASLLTLPASEVQS